MVGGASVFIMAVVQRAFAKRARARLSTVAPYFAKEPGHWTFMLCLAIGSIVFLRERPQLRWHPLLTLQRDSNILNDTLQRNLPIFERLRAGNPRALNTIYAVYLRPENLAKSDLAAGGRLPDIEQGVRLAKLSKKLGYVLLDRSVYRRGEIEALIEAGCAVEVSAGGRVKLDTQQNLPPHCKAPRSRKL